MVEISSVPNDAADVSQKNVIEARCGREWAAEVDAGRRQLTYPMRATDASTGPTADMDHIAERFSTAKGGSISDPNYGGNFAFGSEWISKSEATSASRKGRSSSLATLIG